jgi:hypothetical protein
MRSSRTGYSTMFYKMFVYGRPLTWTKILALQEDSAHRWMPDNPQDSDVCFTDAIWTLRGGEIHLRCEECPAPAAASYRPSRFFHSIIDRDRETITHCDGAIRIFTAEEADRRAATHVRDAGKIGARVKLFQIDGDIQAQHWSEIFRSFFVWNDDIATFAEELATG